MRLQTRKANGVIVTVKLCIERRSSYVIGIFANNSFFHND